MCSFCVCLCGWTRSLCLSALPSDRAPDEVIRTVTGVARLHCLYLAGVSVVRCQIVFTLVVSYSLCQSSRSGGCSRLVASQYSWRLETLHCRVLTATGYCTCRWYLHLHCVLESAPALPAYLTSTVFWSCLIKTICFSLAIGSRAFCTVTPFEGNSRCVDSDAGGTLCVICLEAHVKSSQGIMGRQSGWHHEPRSYKACSNKAVTSFLCLYKCSVWNCPCLIWCCLSVFNYSEMASKQQHFL